MKNCIICLFSLLILNGYATPLVGQETSRSISGTIHNTLDEKIADAYVVAGDSLKDVTADYAEVTFSDSMGVFKIETQKAVNQIIVSRLGYKPVRIPILLEINKYDITMLADESVQVDEVVVSANKQAVKMTPDRLIYDMSYSPVKDGTVFDALRFIPMIQVDNERVSIVGKDDLKYYLNGQELKMTGPALAAYIRSLPAESIQTVEIIPTPDARFRGDGNFGIINIVTKKNENEGWRGRVNATLHKTHYFKERADLLLMYNKKKFTANFFVNGFLSSTWRQSTSDTYYKSQGQNTHGFSEYDGKNTDLGAQALLNYAISPSSVLTGQVNYTYGRENLSELGDIAFFQSGAETSFARIMHDNTLKKDENRITVNLNYQKQFKPQTGITIDADYYYGDVQSSLNHRMDSLLENGEKKPREYYREVIPQDGHVWAGTAQFYTSLWKNTTFATGVEGYYSSINNNDRYQLLKEGIYVDDDFLSNHLKVDEWSTSIFAYISQPWSPKLATSLSASLEYNSYHSDQLNTNQKYSNGNWRVSPVVYMQYKPSNNHILNYSFSYQSARPSFAQMNPFRWYSSATTYQVGNPDLKQAKYYQQELRYMFFQRYLFQVQHSFKDDMVEYYSFVKENDMIEQKPVNIGRSHGLYFDLNGNNFSYWKGRGNLSVSLGYAIKWYKTVLSEVQRIERKNHSFSVRVDNYTELSAKYKITLTCGADYKSKLQYSLSDMPAKLNGNIWLRKSFRNWNFAAYCYAQFMLADGKMLLREDKIYENADLRQVTQTKFESVSYGVTVSYTFGNSRVKSLDERTRTSSSKVRSRME